MNTKRLFFSLTQTGVRMTILVSMLMMTAMGNVARVSAAPLLALSSVTVGTQSGTITAGIAAGGSAAYTVTVTRSAGAPNTPTMSVTGLPAGATASFGTPSAWTPATGTGTRTYPLTITASCVAAGSYNFTVQASGGGPSQTGGGTLLVGSAPVPGPISLYFSTVGSTNPPCATGTADDADIYGWNGVASSRVIDVTTITNPLPGTANVDGFVRVDDTHFFMSFSSDITIVIPGPDLTVADEDIVYYNAGTWTLAFDGSANGLTTGNFDLDAIGIVGGTISANNLYFSTDNTNIPTGAGGTGDDADIYRWNGGSSYTRVVDASVVGVPSTGGGGGSNVDGIFFDTATHFFMSFSNGTTALPVLGNVQDEDIVEYNAGTWSVYFDGTGAGLGASGDLDIDAFSLIFSQTITFGALPDKTFGDPDFNVSATASSGLPVSFSASGNCTVTVALVHLTSDGSCTITASQAGNGSYLPAADVQQTFTINPAAPGISFDLYAVTGSTNLPGLANPVTVWGYNTSNTPVTKPGGPVLVVNQGDSVSITLHNTLTEQTALLLQGQSMTPDLVGADPLVGTKTYTFTAGKPGTFLYEAGLLPNAQHQVAMGLYGALVVRPTGAPLQAYASSATAFDTEQVLVLSELDTALNTSGNPAAFDVRNYSPKYYLINGEAYPDTDPISGIAGDDILLRYVNAGLQAHAMSTLGLSQRIIGQDGQASAFGRTVVAETIATGQTLDVIVTIPSSPAAQYPVYDASLFLRNNTGGGTFTGLGGMLTMINVGTPALLGDTMGPSASSLNLSPNPSNASADVIVTANISDVATGNSSILGAEFYVDTTAGSPTGMTASDSVFNLATESVTGMIPVATLTILSPGPHTIYVHGQDSAGNWGSFQTIVLTVDTTPAAAGTLHFSTAGTTTSGPGGVGASSGDIYYFNGSAFDPGIIAAPAGANVDGFDRVDDTHYYMSFTGDVTLPGVGTVQNEDVVYFNAGAWSLYFDGTANGLGVSNIDSISVAGSVLYFSTSDATLPTGSWLPTDVGDDADIYAWNGSSISRFIDATALGWSGNNVDGFVYVDATHFYLSYSPTGTSVAGLGTVQDEDVVYYNGSLWSVYFDGTVNGLTSSSLDIDAFDVP
jgi:FtsP/CotA-like multicopper oxidase with cupredoxin domain